MSPEAFGDFAHFLTSGDVKIDYVVHMDDIGDIVESQRILYNLSRASSDGDDFAYDKYHTLEEINTWVDRMVSTYPSMVTPITIGKSYENREIKGFKISSSKMATDRDGTKIATKKAVWWDGGLLSLAFSILTIYDFILIQAFIPENGSVQRRSSILPILFCQSTVKIRPSHISLINLIIIFCLYSMLMAMHIRGHEVRVKT